MRKTFPSLALFLIAVLTFSACKKEDDSFKPHSQDPPTELAAFKRVTGFSESLTDISFSDNMNGIVVGTYGFMAKTNDGGKTWTTLNPPTTQSFLSTFCLNKDEMFAARSWLHYTKNGGSSFETLGSNVFSMENSIKSIQFFNSSTGFIVKGNSIYKTTDGGTTWEGKSFNPGYLREAQFLNQSVGYIFGGITYDGYSRGELYKTIDGGNTWTALITTEVPEVVSAHFVSENVGYYANFNGEIFKTTNGGQTWTLVTTGFPDYITDMVFTDNNNGYLTTYGGKVYATDDGTNWKIEFTTGDTVLSKIIATPDKKIWVTGNDGMLLKK